MSTNLPRAAGAGAERRQRGRTRRAGGPRPQQVRALEGDGGEHARQRHAQPIGEVGHRDARHREAHHHHREVDEAHIPQEEAGLAPDDQNGLELRVGLEALDVEGDHPPRLRTHSEVHVRSITFRARIHPVGHGHRRVPVGHARVDRLKDQVDLLRVEREAVETKGLAKRDEPVVGDVGVARGVVDGKHVSQRLAAQRIVELDYRQVVGQERLVYNLNRGAGCIEKSLAARRGQRVTTVEFKVRLDGLHLIVDPQDDALNPHFHAESLIRPMHLARAPSATAAHGVAAALAAAEDGSDGNNERSRLHIISCELFVV